MDPRSDTRFFLRALLTLGRQRSNGHAAPVGLCILVPLAGLLLGCAHPRTKTTAAGVEYRLSGHLYGSKAYCHAPPTLPRRETGKLRVHSGGRRGSHVRGEPLQTVHADAKAGFEVYLPPGRYCLSGGESRFCDVEVIVEEGAFPGAVDVYYQAGSASCDSEASLRDQGIPTDHLH